ncbi:hypothetical protein FB107DRAFT_255782, partial [Schizophyllum commune]
MPKVATQKYYAVLNGRRGPRIYHTIDEYREALDGLSGAVGKRFYSLEKAEEWLRNPDSGQKKSKKNKSRRRYPDSSTLWTEFDDDPRKPGSSKVDAAVQVITADACVQTEEPFECDDSPVRIQGSPPPLPTPRGSPEREYPTPAASVPPELDNARPDEVAAANLPAVSNVIELSPEQRLVLDMVKTGKNVFFTGPAGTGKSVLLREIIKVFKDRKLEMVRQGADKNDPIEVEITAPTGTCVLQLFYLLFDR